MLTATSPIKVSQAVRSAWQAIRNILVVRLDTLSDVLTSTPAIQAIRDAIPQARITLLASRSGVAIARHIPGIDEVIVYDAPWVKGNTLGDLTDRRLITALRRAHFDAAVILTSAGESALPAALICRLSGIPLRLAHSREHPHDLLTHWRQDPGEDVHDVVRQLDLVRSVGFQPVSDRLVLRYAAADVLSMRRKFLLAGGDLRRPYFVVHPGAASALKRYPANRFGLASDSICEASGCQAVYTGGHDELGLTTAAQSQMHEASVALTGKLTLGELAALIAGAQLVICNLGGPAYIASALDTPVVMLSKDIRPHQVPWKARTRVLQHNIDESDAATELHATRYTSLPPEALAEAALELIEAPPAVWHMPTSQASALLAVR